MNLLVDEVRDLVEEKKVVTGRQGCIARRLHTLLGLSAPFSEVRKGLEEAVAWLGADGLVNLQFGKKGVSGMYWVESDGTPNYPWLKTLPAEERTRQVYEWLVLNPQAVDMDPATGLLRRTLNSALADALNLQQFVCRTIGWTSALIRELQEHGYVELWNDTYLVVISAETRAAGLRCLRKRLQRQRDEQVKKLVTVQTTLFNVNSELERMARL